MAPPGSDRPQTTGTADEVPAVPFCARSSTLRQRSDFLRAARGRKQATRGFILQARARSESETSPTPVRIGYTASRKVGNAVARNRAKRRLRAVARAILTAEGKAGWDYVLIARKDSTAALAFATLGVDLTTALRRIHRETT